MFAFQDQCRIIEWRGSEGDPGLPVSLSLLDSGRLQAGGGLTALSVQGGLGLFLPRVLINDAAVNVGVLHSVC